jgi:hypothetical protein
VAGRAYTGDDLIAAITEAATITEAARTTAVRPGEVVTTANG